MSQLPGAVEEIAEAAAQVEDVPALRLVQAKREHALGVADERVLEAVLVLPAMMVVELAPQGLHGLDVDPLEHPLADRPARVKAVEVLAGHALELAHRLLEHAAPRISELG